MKNVKALFIDCDGVLYDKNQCTGYDMVDIGFGKTFERHHISFDEFNAKHKELSHKGIRSVWNTVLELCHKYNLSFDDFTKTVVTNTNYSRVSKDTEMLDLLRRLGAIFPVYIVTNNSAPHLNKIFSCLNGGIPLQNPAKELNIQLISIECTLSDGIFHSKKTPPFLANLCQKLGFQPQNVLMLDDNTTVREAALAQGLQVTPKPIERPEDTKEVLKQILDSFPNDDC